MNKMKWTTEDFKTSEDIVDRTAWFVNTLSPHNLWKGEEAIRQLLADQRKEIIKEIKKMKPLNPEELRYNALNKDRWWFNCGYTEAIDDVLRELEQK